MDFSKYFLLILLFGLSIQGFSQGPPRGGRPGGSPEQMVEREKQNVLKKIDDLNDDQKLLLDGIYSEFATTIEETFQEARQSGDREAIRENMRALRMEKDTLISDVLNEEQYQIYLEISKTKRERGDRKSPEQN
ncbi:MAG: hypothetical protein AAGC47_08490 [Bacteroidota bacterium]